MVDNRRPDVLYLVGYKMNKIYLQAFFQALLTSKRNFEDKCELLGTS